MTLARILKPYQDAQGRWHVPAEIDLPYDASIHLIVSAPEHAISAALQLAAGRVSQAISSGGRSGRALPPPPMFGRPNFAGPEHGFGDFGGPNFGGEPDFDFGGGVEGYRRVAGLDTGYVGYDEVAGWWSDLGRKIGKALSTDVGKSVVKGVVSYIPYVGPAIAQSGLVDMALEAGGAAARKGEGKPKGGRRPTPQQAGRKPKPKKKKNKKLSRAEAIARLKKSGLRFPGLRKIAQRVAANRGMKPRGRGPKPAGRPDAGRPATSRTANERVQQFRDLLEIEHGATGAKHVLRLAKAVKLLERATKGDRAAMGMIDHTAKRAAAGDTRAQMAAGYIGALVRSSGDPLASILRDLGSRRAGYRPSLPAGL